LRPNFDALRLGVGSAARGLLGDASDFAELVLAMLGVAAKLELSP
jgi:hypothetical protein